MSESIYTALVKRTGDWWIGWVQEIPGVSRDELSAFRNWFLEFDAEAWDRQFEQDVQAGRLDRLADEALDEFREGRCTDL